MLVEEENLAEDLGWDAAGGREGVAAGTDLAQRATDGSHLCVDEVKRCRVGEGGGWDLLEDVVDDCNARLDGIGPVLGGSGARHVCVRDKSFDPRSRVEWPSATPPVKLGKLTLHCRCSFRGKKRAGRWTMALPTPTKAIGYPTDNRAGNHPQREIK